MNGASIREWLDWLGGVDLIWLVLVCLAGTQLWKMLLDAFNLLQPKCVRPMPYLVGAFASWFFVEYSARGAMVGVAAGMVSSLGYYAASAYLERDAAPVWQKNIARRMSIK